MPKTIWKFEIENQVQVIEMPKGAEILTVQLQHGKPCLWAIVDPNSEKAGKKILIFGTGHEMPEGELNYIGTYQVQGGFYVFHVFEEK